MLKLQLEESLCVKQAATLANLSIKTIRKEVANGSFKSEKRAVKS